MTPEDNTQESLKAYHKAGSPNTAAEDLMVLGSSEDREIRRRVATNVNAPPLLLTLLSEDPNQTVRLAVGTNPSAPRNIIWKLSEDRSERVRKGLASDPRTPLCILCSLARDADMRVAASARKTIEKLNQLDCGIDSATTPATRLSLAKIGRDSPVLEQKSLDHPDLPPVMQFHRIDPGQRTAFETYVECSPDGLIVLDNNHELEFANKTALKMLGLEVAGGRHSKTDLSQLLSSSPVSIKTERGVRIIEPRWSLLQDGGSVKSLIALRDVTKTARLMKRLKEESLTDELTGLFNRRGFFVVGSSRLRLAVREKRHVALIVIDIDGLKQINDRLGHPAGDSAIASLARLLKKTFRTSDIPARIGGDEFVVLITAPEELNPQCSIDRLQKNIDEFNREGQNAYELSISCGISTGTPGEPLSLSSMYKQADKGMYRHKHSTR